MKILKIIFILCICVLFCNKVYAKYTYNFNEKIITLTREKSDLKCEVSYSTQEWTASNVIITITANREILPVSGFELSKDRKKLKRKVSKNESGNIIVIDLSGNSQKVEYSVTNIDKDAPEVDIPEIEENDEENPEFFSLEYTDNVGIKDIYIDKFEDELIVDVYNNYWDSANYYGIDKTNKTLTIHISGHPENTKQYRYYLNDEIYTISKEKVFTFTNLKKGTDYIIKIEALDEFGDILDSKIIEEKTTYYSNISSQKSDDEFEAYIEETEKEVFKIKYAVWNYNNPDIVKWYDAEVMDNNSWKIICQNEKNEYYPFYGMHVYFYDVNDNILDVIEFSIDFQTDYQPQNEEIDVNKLEKSGNYKIIVSDFAENQKIEYLKVK